MALLPAVRPIRCAENECDFPLGGPCARLHAHPEVTCDRLVRRARPAIMAEVAPELEAEDAPVAESTPPPWAGVHLRLDLLDDLTRRARPRFIAVVGPSDVGKTSLLASFFLQIANGHYGGLPYRFDGSRTLLAFDHLVLRANQGALEHTTTDQGARFLHLGLRPYRNKKFEDRHIDVLLSDISGEDVAAWSQNATSEAAQAMAFVRNADVVLVLADAGKLTRAEGRAHDGVVANLLRRIGAVLRDLSAKPAVGLVFTKIDTVVEMADIGAQQSVPFDPEAWRLVLRAGAIRTAMAALQRQGLTLAGFSTSSVALRGDVAPLGVITPLRFAIETSDRLHRHPRPRSEITTKTSGVLLYAHTPKPWEAA